MTDADARSAQHLPGGLVRTESASRAAFSLGQYFFTAKGRRTTRMMVSTTPSLPRSAEAAWLLDAALTTCKSAAARRGAAVSHTQTQ